MVFLVGVYRHFYQNLPRCYQGRVIKVYDGDTVLFEDIKSKSYKVRLFGIDAPEIDQKSFEGIKIGEMAKRYLSQMIKNDARVCLSGKDFYQRFLGELYIGKLNLNLKLLQSGHVLVYPRTVFSSYEQKSSYERSAFQAIMKRNGIWKTKGFSHPQHFRKQKKRLEYRKRLKI